MLSAHRYVAYTSDIGESFRPIAHPWLIRGAYAVSWAYLMGDVGFEGYKAYLRNQRIRMGSTAAGDTATSATSAIDATTATRRGGEAAKTSALNAGMLPELWEPGKVPAIEDYRAVMAQRAVFQSLASMGLPAFTIHSIVRYSGRALKGVKNVRIRTWGPIGVRC